MNKLNELEESKTIVFEAKDPFKRTIKLKKYTWEYKILNFNNANCNNEHGNSHPEMEPMLLMIQESIEKPTFILKDTKIITDEEGNEKEVVSENREENIKIYFNEKNELNSIKTIVEYDNTKKMGEIVTAHKITGPMKKIKKGGGIIYDSTKRE